MAENETLTPPSTPITPAKLETVSEKGVVAGREILKKINLVTQGAYVIALMNPRADLLEQMAKDGVELNTTKMAPYLIREWNFIGEDGERLPITIENVKLALSFQDNELLLRELGFSDLFSGAKKNS